MTPSINLHSHTESNIHIAKNSELKSVCDILASAFTNDPVLQWLSGYAHIYPSLFRSEVEALYKHHNHIYINNEHTGAALWLPPGVPVTAPFHWRVVVIAWKMLRTKGYRSIKRATLLDKVIEANQPEEPHFYLHAIGASLDNQGRGIGSALIKAGLATCDKLGMPAYLESSNEKNNPLYERHGFRIIRENKLPDGGPKVWYMQREVHPAH